VSWRVSEDERARVGGEESVGNVDRDPLFALGAQAIRDRGEVELSSRPA
jgi:hypothetical protein